MNNTIIFDFDGTIADSFDTVLAVTNRLAVEFGYAPASPAEIKSLQNLSSREILKQSRIPLYKLPSLLRRLKREMQQEIHHIQPFPGMLDALMDLHDQGYALGILTSNTKENVAFFLETHQVADLFWFVHSSVTLFGKSRRINQLLRTYSLTQESVIYVGDETRDVDAARRSHIKILTVGWGFNSVQALTDAHPDGLIRSPKDLVEAIAQLSAMP
ncbi:HAD hydrolase-like protein [Vacuolonema iberomarrocanum]|uniref:HAD hydrolase-like protein n=1 Tax=Vacuolonema iberomarrocanum TaxID=3454632 RepID=UPI0019F2AAB9|nr:HAD hydrolase-like protein [filamentous cyanobacterium LEGE 07170]